MAHFERQLEANMACMLGPGTLDITAVHQTGDRAEPFVSTSVAMSFGDFGTYETLAPLVTHMNRVVHRAHADIPQTQPVGLWVNRMCLRANHEPAKNVSALGAGRLERVFAALILPEEMKILKPRVVSSAAQSTRVPNMRSAFFESPKNICELFQSVDYVHVPLITEEAGLLKNVPEKVVFLGQTGKVAVYGAWQQLPGHLKPIAEVLNPSAVASYRLRG